MDDDACIMKLIENEIDPIDDYWNFSGSSDVRLSPCCIKVCVQFILCA